MKIKELDSNQKAIKKNKDKELQRQKRKMMTKISPKFPQAKKRKVY